MKIEEHLISFEEHKDVIEWAINRGLDRSQRIVGTHASRGIVELLSAYLRKINNIDAGFQINHRWFKTERAKERFSAFPRMDEIIKKMTELENTSEILTYGSQKTEKEVKEAVKLFNELETIIEGLMEDGENRK